MRHESEVEIQPNEIGPMRSHSRRKRFEGQVSCPTCGRRFTPQETDFMPFCSERCRQVDLGRWFDEQFGLPIESEQEAEPS